MHRLAPFLAVIVLLEVIVGFGVWRCCRRRPLWKWYLGVHLPWWSGLAAVVVIPWTQWPAPLNYAWLGLGWLLLLTKLLLGVVALIGWGWQLSSRRSNSDRPPDLARRRFLARSADVALALPLTTGAGAALITPHMLKVRKHTFNFSSLPAAFDGLRMVQISDLHLGTFSSEAPVRRLVAAVQAQQPDVVFFTGDLVNYRAQEAEPFLPLLKKIQAPLGVYAVLGNHDYGAYYPWPNPQARRRNFRRLLQLFPEMGWRLLRNEHVLLQKDGARIAVVGLENWNRYGRLQKADYARATRHLPPDIFRIVLAHDPHYFEDHLWKKKRADLTLSGHTHGFQMGIEIGKWRWSPAQYMYRFWADAYQWPGQTLYVSRGAGMVGLPFRIGIWPEITVFELQRC